jgi:hypothetical protein
MITLLKPLLARAMKTRVNRIKVKARMTKIPT